MKNQVQLIAYVDRLSGGGFKDLNALLKGPLAGVFGGAHLLPFFTPIDGADAGFDPSDHTQVDPRLGTWDDVRALGTTVEIVADLIVNHVSSSSPQFLDFSKKGATMVQKQIELVRLRNTHPAFAGDVAVAVPTSHVIDITWKRDRHWLMLSVDLSVRSATITGSSPTGGFRPIVIRDV